MDCVADAQSHGKQDGQHDHVAVPDQAQPAVEPQDGTDGPAGRDNRHDDPAQTAHEEDQAEQHDDEADSDAENHLMHRDH